MSPALSTFCFAVAVLLYGVSTALFYLEVMRGRADRKKEPAPSLAAVITLACGACAHGIYVVLASFVAHVCPVHSAHFFLSVASLIATGAYLFARRRFRIHALGLMVAPIGLVLTLGTFFLGRASTTQRLPAWFIGLHVFAILAGIAMLLLACGAAIMYLVQERRLKSKKAMLGKKLPPLDSLDRAAHRFLIAGFPLMTLAVVAGTVWASRLEWGAPLEQLRIGLGYLAWLLFAAVLLLRVVGGWRGRRAAYGTVAGFALTLLVLVFYMVRPMLSAGAGG